MTRMNRAFALVLLSILLFAQSANSMDRRGRLGIGMSNQLKNDLPAISFKLQKSNAFAFGGLVGVSTRDPGGGHGFGLKVYRNLFDEPQLTFYTSLLAAIIKERQVSGDDEGFQFDLTVGSEFSFAGLQSLGFSFETGISLNKINGEFGIETVGYHFVTAGILFYL
tara:strand:- start:166584 stop:167081 length:498 start_codon:yes stop_codon:yes gene_type:complete